MILSKTKTSGKTMLSCNMFYEGSVVYKNETKLHREIAISLL
jgi:hypothetical protein